ncbi:MAG: type II secretion system protein [candidate division WOR-3 bacterium]
MSRILNSKKKGLTLVEIAIVLIILGMATSVSIPLILSLTRQNKIAQAEAELNALREIVLNYYKLSGKLPPHTADFRLPADLLQIPPSYIKDPITSNYYLYFCDSTNITDSVYIDNIPIGAISAVIICSGKNGKFDGENANPSNRRFQSTGSGDFDDIISYISELDLYTPPSSNATQSQVCNNFTFVISNWTAYSYTARILSYPNHDTSTTIRADSTVIQGIPTGSAILVFPTGSTREEEFYSLNINTFNEGSDCKVRTILFYSYTTPRFRAYLTPDLSR